MNTSNQPAGQRSSSIRSARPVRGVRRTITPDPITGLPISRVPTTPLAKGPQLPDFSRGVGRSRRTGRRSSNVLLNIPIAGRLTLGFLIAALFATLATGVVGFERSQLLIKETDFYQQLLQTNTSLDAAANYLQLMNTKLHEIYDNSTSNAFSQETQSTDEKALQLLETNYSAILSDYVRNALVDRHPDQLNLLTEAGNQALAQQQHTLLASVQRTWLTYNAGQQMVLQDVNAKNTQDAQLLLRAQAEPTNADALSAMRTLIQLGSSLARSVNAAAAVEQQTLLITTLIIAVIASLCIGLFGWFISRTLVKRLNLLRRVTQRVEQGQLDSRVTVIGRDEIADVSLSVNTMLDTIVGLLQETRSQRDALTNAATHLFSHMQVVSTGELRTNTTAHNDPIGMLADAFNFTIGRVRRFIMRTQTNLDRLEVILRQDMEHSEQFMHLMQMPRQYSPVTSYTGGERLSPGPAKPRTIGSLPKEPPNSLLAAQLKQAQQYLLQGARTVAHTYIRTILAQSKQINIVVGRIKRYDALPGEKAQKEQDLHTLEMLVRELETLMQTMQANASKELSEVEKILNQSLATLHAGEREFSQLTASGAIEMALVSEMTQLSIRFVQDSTALTRQITAIAQELRVNMNSFKLDEDDPAPFSPSSPLSGDIKL